MDAKNLFVQAATSARHKTTGRSPGARHYARLFTAAGLIGLASCGGGGGGSPSPAPAPSPGAYTPGVFPASTTFAAKCAAPRSGMDPITGVPFPDVMGSTVDENNWLRSWTNELYLWYREVPDLDPANTPTTAAYFALLKTSATTPSGQLKDHFHFTLSTAEWESFSQSGATAGYGATWELISPTVPRNVVVAFTEPGTPAVTANLVRGAQVLTVDNVDVVNATGQANVNALNAGLFPTAAGQMHTFSILDPGAAAPRTVSMTSANITETPVQNVGVIQGTTVGYMLFNDHIATAEQALMTAVTTLKSQNITDLVLDLRYNGGGYLDVASELAYMIAGSAATTGKTFELTTFNDKHPTTNPVTRSPIMPVPFHPTALGFSVPAGTALPTLNLPRVFVLTSGGTCSASEAVINSLRGIGVTVYQFGSTTCGKPYGFYPQDNCGTTYFSIEFKGVNQIGFGDYSDGFSPMNTVANAGVTVAGCSVADDFSHALGDPNERQLGAALAYLATPGTCPAPSGKLARAQSMRAGALGGEGIGRESPWRTNRIYRR